MHDILAESIRRLKRKRIQRIRMIAIVLALSLVVSMDVFWVLRQPGLTLAGDADCKITEHTHDEACQNGEIPCELAEHVHAVECYSDETADAETQLDWQAMFESYPYTENLRENLVGIAKTQVGYSESALNFQIDNAGHRHGYTRYGAWYGTPYSEWSAMFVSFCLHYAGADPEEFPYNTGALSMAKLWDSLQRYADAGSYVPVPGDLVFLADNSVGIIAEMQSSTVYVIRGDVDNSVVAGTIPLSDPSILGWGITGEIAPAPPPEEEAMASAPAFLASPPEYAAMPVDGAAPAQTPADMEIVPYLETNGGHYFITLLDINNHELPKDSNGHYTAKADTAYKLTVSFTSPSGFDNSGKAIYHYQLTDGFQIDAEDPRTGTFVLKDSTDVGSWVMADDRMVTLEFNENIDNRSDITVSFTLKISFPAESEPVDFDGKITVAIEKKPQQVVTHTEMNKWGVQGDPANAQDPNNSHKTDPNKIYWTVLITGNRDSDIIGSVLSDRVLMHDWSYSHSYTEADIAAGLNIGASVVNPETGQETDWHRWTVLPGDQNLTWTEDSWSYTMPEKITCSMCGNEITLGNEYWGYYVEYTSTPHAANIAGELGYSNMAAVDGQAKEGWAGFTHAEIAVDAFKTGTLVSDAGGGKFLWEIKVSIPGWKPGDVTIQDWIIGDGMLILDANYNRLALPNNDFLGATITANYRGKTITVPRIQDATEDDPYAWRYGWYDASSNSHSIQLLHRCDCTDESCGYAHKNCWTWDYTRDDGVYVPASGYCSCWTETEDTTLTFTYQTDAAKIIADYGGNGNMVQNQVTLSHSQYWGAAYASAVIPIPSVLEKTIPPQPDSDIVHYNITLNESRLVLTDGSPLTITDVMTDTLTYISGSLVVKAVDADGNETALKQGTDFTVAYDGSGNQSDNQNNPAHVLSIVILHPQPLKYLLDYDATFIIPDQVSEGIKYSNYAYIKLWGETILSSVPERIHANINYSANNYKLELYKTAADSGEALQGAIFGLYNEHGGLITTATTNTNGQLTFQTYVPQGIIIRDHVLYYVQELKAPPGYQLDNTKHWFYFCDETDRTCQLCNGDMAATGATRFLFDINTNEAARIDVVNQLMRYELPSTGGPGIYPLVLASVIMIIAPLVYISILRRKRERGRSG